MSSLTPSNSNDSSRAKALRSFFRASILASTLAVTTLLRAETEPTHWSWAPTPPMGWNSYDAWGTSIVED